MASIEGFRIVPEGPGSNEEKLSQLPQETINKIKGFSIATRTWEQLEKTGMAAVPEDPELYDEVIDSLRFLKEKNLRHYTPEQEAEQFKKVDAYIARLKGEAPLEHEEGEGLRKAS